MTRRVIIEQLEIRATRKEEKDGYIYYYGCFYEYEMIIGVVYNDYVMIMGEISEKFHDTCLLIADESGIKQMYNIPVTSVMVIPEMLQEYIPTGENVPLNENSILPNTLYRHMEVYLPVNSYKEGMKVAPVVGGATLKIPVISNRNRYGFSNLKEAYYMNPIVRAWFKKALGKFPGLFELLKSCS